MSKNNKEILRQYIEKYPFSGDIIRSDFKKLGVNIDFYEFEKWFSKNRNNKEVRDVISNNATSIKQNRKGALSGINKKVNSRKLRLPKLGNLNSYKGAFDEGYD